MEKLIIGWLLLFSFKQKRQKYNIKNEGKKPKDVEEMSFQSLPSRTLCREVERQGSDDSSGLGS